MRERERDEIDKGISVNIDRGKEIEKEGKESNRREEVKRGEKRKKWKRMYKKERHRKT